MILLNIGFWRKLLCHLGFHVWVVAGTWRQETKATQKGDWYLQQTWDDYLCRYCGRWERGYGDYKTMTTSYGRFWKRRMLPDIIEKAR